MRKNARLLPLLLAFVVIMITANTASAAAESPVRIDCDFPGGNIILERIEGDTVFVRQDLRDTSGDWFYWSFRVRGAEGKTLTFRFPGKVILVRGPAVSSDDGQTWRWLNSEAAKEPGSSFTYRFGPEEKSVRFSTGMSYQKSDLDAFLKKYASRDDFVVEHHATSPKGREVPRIRFGAIKGEPNYRVLLTCRHHSCEMMASWALEGLIDAVMADDSRGRWLRKNVEFLCVPIVDLDGTEDGDQGKKRKPHDHNRDYHTEPPLYPEVAAIKQFVPSWSKGRLRLAIDLHCPYIYGKGKGKGDHHTIFMAGNPEKESAEKLLAFSKMLEAVQVGPLKYDHTNNLPWGISWNKLEVPSSCTGWANRLPGIDFSTSLEIPYADVSGNPVMIESARAFGADLASAIEQWLRRSSACPTVSDVTATITWDKSTQKLAGPKGTYGRITRLSDRHLLLVGERKGDIYVWHSNDNGKTWPAGSLVAEYEHGIAANPEVLKLSNGNILLCYNERPSEDGKGHQFTIKTTISTDDGQSWSTPTTAYVADQYYGNGCWEPAAIQLPSGEIKIYFANENNFRDSKDQEISVIRSNDNGVHWSKAERASYRPERRDGMPVPLILKNGHEIIAIEDNGIHRSHQRFQPSIIDLTSGTRWPANRPLLDPPIYAGAPYIRQFPSGETILSCQSDEGHARQMVVYVGDSNARNFTNRSVPFTLPADTMGKWNSLFIKDDHTITAVTRTTINGQSGLYVIDGYLTPVR